MIELSEKLEELICELKKVHPETFYHCLRVKRLVSGMLFKTNRGGLTDYTGRDFDYI